MKMQVSATELKWCTKCDKAITRTESRHVDGTLHQHLKCNDAITKKKGE